MAWLVAALERSDVIVHIEDRVLAVTRIIGETRVVCAGGQRYLRISLDPVVRDHAAIALLGHELQHAWEIAQRSWVIDRATLERLYQEIGHGVDGGFGIRRFDTPAGPDTERRVRAELRSYGVGRPSPTELTRRRAVAGRLRVRRGTLYSGHRR
jgi:hypothetical protein